MAYILKNTSGLVNTRVTDAGRQKMSQGQFNISYFQIGDSEVSYGLAPSIYNQFNTNILEPNFNSQNTSGVPNSNKQNVKYPYFVDGITGNTYGIPYMDSIVSPVFNRAPLRGFFGGNLTAETITWSALTDSRYVINSDYIVDMSTLQCGKVINLIYSPCGYPSEKQPAVGDFITIYYDGKGLDDCYCTNLPTPTPTPTPTSTSGLFESPTPTPTPTKTPYDCNPSPTPTPSSTPCLTPSASRSCPPPPPPDCKVPIYSCYPMMTYRIVSVCGNQITLDRPTPDFTELSASCYSRVLVYPSNMTKIYDSVTPRPHWADDVINYESICDIDQFDVKVWNMNIPWSENPAGLISSLNKDYTKFGSINYLGTKEYLGYQSDSGQTDSSEVFYYNSFDEKVVVTPKEQKAIAVIHYTNQTIDFFYGEKFAFEPFDPSNEGDTTGQARNFKLHIPWIMWHKNESCCFGQTFWVDPPNFENVNLFQVHYIESNKNLDMNSPGIRYYHLWDTNPNSIDGYPNRVGKVFPDQKIVVIDDEELIAAMSYKSNRNWTLPAPKISLMTPNVCGGDGSSPEGVLTASTEYMHVTYRFTNTSGCLSGNSLHCNYYSVIEGPNIVCSNLTSQNIAIRFGDEFPCLTQPDLSCCNQITGFYADKFEIICQKVEGNGRPNSSLWKIIDFTDQLTATTINNYITKEGLTGNTFVITKDQYDSAPTYDLNDYVPLTPVGYSGVSLNFGDEYYFYGALESDIQATIYEMRYKVNLGESEFQATTNPTWIQGNPSYITEIGLYDSDKTLMIVSKLQSPVLRQGIQQFLVKFDF